METKCSLPHLQVPATCPCSKPDRSNLCPHILLPEGSYLHHATARNVAIYISYYKSHIFSAHILLLTVASFPKFRIKMAQFQDGRAEISEKSEECFAGSYTMSFLM
jgi:hypothetical protein